MLGQIGVRFEVMALDIDEAVLEGEAPRAYVERLARAKAGAGWQRVERDKLPRAPVLGADTTVAVGGRILGKAADAHEASEMLGALSGKLHEVLTALAVHFGERVESAVSVSEVRFKTLDEKDIADYVASGEWQDKAGAYGIQGYGAALVDRVEGDFFGVMGLPVRLVLELLEEAGFSYEFKGP